MCSTQFTCSTIQEDEKELFFPGNEAATKVEKDSLKSQFDWVETNDVVGQIYHFVLYGMH